jgi:hypothetical protein
MAFILVRDDGGSCSDELAFEMLVPSHIWQSIGND